MNHTELGLLKDYFSLLTQFLKEEYLLELKILAQECDEQIRNRSEDDSWYNRSGNLRSSIGAAVYDSGVVYFKTAFPAISGGSLGSSKGRELINQLSSEYSKTIGLVIVAGMDYAEEIEAMESKDVLESTKLYAESVVEKRLQAATNRVLQRLQTMFK